MKRLLFCVLLISCSASWAKWVYYSSSDDGTDFYYEDTSRRKNGATVKMWGMFSGMEGTLEGKIYRSFKEFTEYDCGNEVTKRLALTFYADELGAGEVIFTHTYTENKWDHISPGSIGVSAWKLACSKK
jgi:hypothetical protein